jgi:3-carboxy-cis,cis-muconate cycloisomerase
MTFSPTDSKIYAPLFSDPDTAALFSDEQFVQYLLEVETALAKAQGRLGVIPAKTAETIASAAASLRVDFEQLQAGTEKAGLPIIELVRQLREQVGGEAASYIHWGATTQDIMDTALVLQIRAALSVIENKLLRLIKNLARLADQHRSTLMAGRTHSQQALPIPFGLKVAGWLAPLLRHRQRLAEIKPRLLVVQLGGAAGTLASLGQVGINVQAALAAELNLSLPLMPWHTQRDNLAELAGWLSLVSGSLAKLGQDIILLAQTEVDEVRESSDRSAGGSSTMPQKSNPIVSELVIAAARANASLLSSMHQALVQEHERATHGWQVEWLTLPQMFALTSAALNKAIFLSDNLEVNEGRMRQNVAASNGLMLAEAINFALTAAHTDRAEAKQLIKEACQVAIDEGRHLVDVVQEKANAFIEQDSIDWQALKDETAYFGSSEAFINRVLHEAGKI